LNFVRDDWTAVRVHCRRVNALFACSSLGVQGGFNDTLGVPSNVAITGRIYHQLRDIDRGQHSLRWFLYDQDEQDATANGLGVSPRMVAAVRRLLDEQNPYARYLRSAFASIPRDVPYSLELSCPVANGEVAAIVNVANMQQVGPRSVVVHRGRSQGVQTVSVLSPQYEPLQYPLL